MLKARMLLAVSAFIAAAITACDNASLGSSDLSQPLTVAFIGDQGSGDGARAVLELIKAEGADLVLHQGDFDYTEFGMTNVSTYQVLDISIEGKKLTYKAYDIKGDVRDEFVIEK